MDLKLKGQKALITGATKGLGRAMAEVLAGEGVDIALCARNAAEVESTVAALKAKGVNAYGAVVDAANGDALKKWVTDAAAALGGCDIIIPNVSGGNAPGEAGWRANFEVDLLGSLRCIEAAMPSLEKSSNGNIVLIASTAGLEHFIGAGAYNAIKAALIAHGGALAQDLAAKGIRVNVISPGPILVEGGPWDMIRKNMKPFFDQTAQTIALKRHGTADEVAVQVACLVSPRSGFTTGANIVIDGGFTKRIQF